MTSERSTTSRAASPSPSSILHRPAGRGRWLAAEYPAKIEYRIRRITSGGSIAVAELSIRYDGGPWMFGVSINEFRRDKVVHERIYVMDGWESAEWRAPWRSATPADPSGD